MAEDIQEEWKELNEEGWCNYIRKELIIVVQIPLAVIGGILAAVLGGHAFWSFVYWSHAITASVIVALNVFLQLQNVFKKRIINQSTLFKINTRQQNILKISILSQV